MLIADRGSGFISIPDPWVKKSTGPQIRIRNTEKNEKILTR
jgi:hypothetical protein